MHSAQQGTIAWQGMPKARIRVTIFANRATASVPIEGLLLKITLLLTVSVMGPVTPHIFSSVRPNLTRHYRRNPCNRHRFTPFPASSNVSFACQNTTGSMASAATESDHHQPNHVFNPIPANKASDK